ncbi:hypothetical protein DYB37_006784 [Aphanomyces astaci]|uniref:Uncharacterized protein n=1 Tax=Aphanomyces astaci TaxID=112090 RepID=A0A3R6YUG0_APHAT|nr:hypothetical protein DYB35_005654 [Aphanomyces astaci]RHZ24697.1 hypothetical protein DYB37_006784 [Aphanomyces astaci]
MESISPVQYDRLVALQKRRSARLIQRRWKEYTLSANYQRNFHHHHDWDTDEDDTNDLNQSSESAPSSFTPSKAIDAMTFLAKKQEIHQRIRDAVRQISVKHPWKIPATGSTKADGDAARRATYEKLQRETANWTARFNEHCTTLRQPKRASASDDSCADDDSIRQFLTRSSTPHVKSGSNGTLSTNPSPSLDKHEHALDPAMSSHLWLHYADAMSTPSAAVLANVTSIMTTHPALLAYQQPSLKATDDVFGLTFDAIVRSQTAHLVADITSQITFNTQLRSVQDHTKKATSMEGGDEDASDVAFPGGLVDYGGLRRHHMATRIQRRVRGNKGRVEAQEVL